MRLQPRCPSFVQPQAKKVNEADLSILASFHKKHRELPLGKQKTAQIQTAQIPF